MFTLERCGWVVRQLERRSAQYAIHNVATKPENIINERRSWVPDESAVKTKLVLRRHLLRQKPVGRDHCLDLWWPNIFTSTNSIRRASKDNSLSCGAVCEATSLQLITDPLNYDPLNPALMMSPRLVMKRLQSNCQARRTDQQSVSAPELPIFHNIADSLQLTAIRCARFGKTTKSFKCFSVTTEFSPQGIGRILQTIFRRHQYHRLYSKCQNAADNFEITGPLRVPNEKITNFVATGFLRKGSVDHIFQLCQVGKKRNMSECPTISVLLSIRCTRDENTDGIHQTHQGDINKEAEGWDTAELPKPKQAMSRGRGRVRTADLSTHELGVVDKFPQTHILLERQIYIKFRDIPERRLRYEPQERHNGSPVVGGYKTVVAAEASGGYTLFRVDQPQRFSQAGKLRGQREIEW
ncbi:hypothetical protein CLF_108948 [Clonorchis sinensis]|uniref:Uncharacterized protein n=1 Tax=Clonorchis sinensis TaxID=79923 RepID=G7YS37_CLOSI|nr:hypothetical protein CLF_108948 [Clonorchis sinensis]